MASQLNFITFHFVDDETLSFQSYKVGKTGDTLRKPSDTGPSFSDAASSCSTFSNPLIMAYISSANDFNCICIATRLLMRHVKNKIWDLRRRKNNNRKGIITFDAASKLTRSSWKSRRNGDLEASTWDSHNKASQRKYKKEVVIKMLKWRVNSRNRNKLKYKCTWIRTSSLN